MRSLAKLGATADHLSGGRFAVNVVSGWFKDEFTHLGEPWLESGLCLSPTPAARG